jgi:predicted MFS family arabinose efflux permease
MALRVGSNATYWADIFPPILLLALGISLAIAPLTTLVLTSVESDRAGTASGVNSAVSRAGSLFAIALLGGVLQQGGPQLFSGFHMAMALAAVACVTRQREKAHEDPNHYRRHLRHPRLLDGRPHLRP